MFEESKHFSSGVFEVQDSSWKFKEEVAETAISLFKRDGYNNVTVNDKGRAANLDIPLLIPDPPIEYRSG